MVATVAEFHNAKALLAREIKRSTKLGEALPSDIKVGVMLEVPALMWQLPVLLDAVDFLSVGTNDLIQFLFASDRGNTALSQRYGLLTPAALTLMRELVEACDSRGVPLTVCGEAAGNTIEAMALIGVGVRRLSMSQHRLGAVKVMCRGLEQEPLSEYLKALCRSPESDLKQRLLDFAHDHEVEI
jgi:phosphotransferase system enzyme I (PtsP)